MGDLFSNNFILVIAVGVLVILIVSFILIIRKKKRNGSVEEVTVQNNPVPEFDSLNEEIKPFSEQSFNAQLRSQNENNTSVQEFDSVSKLVPEINSTVSTPSFEQSVDEIVIEDVSEPIIDIVDTSSDGEVIDIVEPTDDGLNNIQSSDDLFNSMFGQSVNGDSSNNG